jgi:hypothetical protein
MTVEPNETTVARHWLGKQISAAPNTHATIEQLLDALFLFMWSTSSQIFNMQALSLFHWKTGH